MAEQVVTRRRRARPGRVVQILVGVAGLVAAALMGVLSYSLPLWLQVSVVAAISLVAIVGLREGGK
jgi:membrane protein implicated in regulation of membrane protease activity